ncbi:hypothetical protein AB0C04_31515 [Micromonospora sp. NPDC048909]|uniref:hypothetical protein n=1 Tax=Micromonospora sp. NPDC048909 TaxID=3155643 RepID=UPI0033F26A88
MMLATVHRLLLRRLYGSISDRIGRRLLIDDVHLNERVATVVADVIQRFVRGPEDHA